MINIKEKYKNDLNFNLKQKIVEAIIFSSSEPIPFKALQKTVSDNYLLEDILISLEIKKGNSMMRSSNMRLKY